MRTAVRAHEISSLLDDAPEGLRCLSLDCFDTLLWRNVHAPIDVFADLDIAGGAVDMRRAAESYARRMRKQIDRRDEVSIEAIYEALMPGGAAEERSAAVDAEIAAEAHHCFPFAPTVALMRAAKARNLKIIIVSDTYLSAVQLRKLIAQAAGDDVAALIDAVFVSSEHGITKGQGLFRPVLAKLKLRPETILHLGDNHNADAKAPRMLGITGVHFEQFTPQADQRLRLEAAAAAMMDPANRISRPIFQPHRPSVSLFSAEDSAAALGHDVLGPLIDTFVRWIRHEAAELASRTGRRVRPLFLLRDGHLPHRAYEAAGFTDGATITVSRFSANAAGFRHASSIRALLSEESIQCHQVLGRQLLLRDDEIARIGRDRASFCRGVLAPQWVECIRKRSLAYAQRLVAHFRNQGGVEPGDAVMLVDLGYNGTVQNVLEPVLAEALDVHVAGRYLLLRETVQTAFDKRGMLDARNYEFRLLNALCRPIAVLEQLCTIVGGSVIDYSPDGDPIRKAIDVKGGQNATRDGIQDACIAYVREADSAFHRLPASCDLDARSRAAGAVLTRLLFLPQSDEVVLLRQFDHDINLGTAQTVKLIDSEAAGRGLRRRGLPYLSEVERIYLPGEVQPHGLPLALSLFTVGRFGLDLRHGDFHVGGIDVPLLIVSGNGEMLTTAKAYPTHDGYYLLTAPAGTGGMAIGVQLGSIAECVQVDEIAFYAVDAFTDISAKPAAPATPLFDAMEEIAPGVHRCAENGLIFVPPPAGVHADPLVLTIAFRPIVNRATRAETSLRKAA